MDYAYMLGGGTPHVMSFAIGNTHSDAGIITVAPVASGGDAGVMVSTTTTMLDSLGVTYDTGTYVTAQQTDGTSAERKVKVCVSPDAVYRALMSGGSAEGTALTEYTVSAASADGLDVTDSALTWTNPAWDEGSVAFISGVNSGQIRKVTATSGSVATISTAFDNDHAVGDLFIRFPWWFVDIISDALQSTTLLTQADASIAVGTGGSVKIIDMEVNTSADSFVLFTLDDHVLNHSKAGIDG